MTGDNTAPDVTRPGVGALAVGAAACAACSAGPILGAIGAIGVASAVGYALVGVVAIVAGIAAVALVVISPTPAPKPCVDPASTVALVDAPTTRRPETPTGREAATRRHEPAAPA